MWARSEGARSVDPDARIGAVHVGPAHCGSMSPRGFTAFGARDPDSSAISSQFITPALVPTGRPPGCCTGSVSRVDQDSDRKGGLPIGDKSLTGFLGGRRAASEVFRHAWSEARHLPVPARLAVKEGRRPASMAS